ncbi:MAG: 6-carboxytetrahydropterin synthase QueD [Deltaproteobacteria bacterium]|nr:6-carboxytetrahydropterin synthase QueD [Deltaproteobacteria bacterium]
MYEVEIITGFSAAHLLRNYNGKCERLHGHNYKVTVTARATALDAGGMVIDFVELKRAANSVAERLDHAFLNEIEPFTELEPSAENIAAYFFREVVKLLDRSPDLLYSVSVWETDTSRATFIRDSL